MMIQLWSVHLLRKKDLNCLRESVEVEEPKMQEEKKVEKVEKEPKMQEEKKVEKVEKEPKMQEEKKVEKEPKDKSK